MKKRRRKQKKRKKGISVLSRLWKREIGSNPSGLQSKLKSKLGNPARASLQLKSQNNENRTESWDVVQR